LTSFTGASSTLAELDFQPAKANEVERMRGVIRRSFEY